MSINRILTTVMAFYARGPATMLHRVNAITSHGLPWLWKLFLLFDLTNEASSYHPSVRRWIRRHNDAYIHITLIFIGRILWPWRACNVVTWRKNRGGGPVGTCPQSDDGIRVSQKAVFSASNLIFRGFWGLGPTPPDLCPWTPLRTFVPRPSSVLI